MLRILIILAILSFSTDADAQKKELSEAKTYLKKNTSLDKAENLVRKAILMPGLKDKNEAYTLLSDIMRRQYETCNEKLYLKQLSDTASLFPALRKMYAAYEQLDSVESIPDSKGNIRTKSRKKNAEFLNRFRPNLFSGALYSLNKKNYQEAFDCIETYLGCHSLPMFSSLDLTKSDTLRYRAAYLGVLAAYNMKNHAGVRKYQRDALNYEPQRHNIIALLYESYMQQKDTVTAVAYLREGFRRHSEYPFFFPRLVDHYSSRNKLDTVKAIVDKAIEIEPGNMFYRLAKNIVQLNMGEYDDCVALGDSLIHNNDKLAEAYYNVGTAYFNKAVKREKTGNESRQKRKEVNSLYEKSMPYLERYRILRQKELERWAPMLYTIYLNLNKGKEFDEIDSLIKKHSNNRKKD